MRRPKAGGRVHVADKITFSRGPRNILIRPFSTLLRASSGVLAADVLTKVPSPSLPSSAHVGARPPFLPPFTLLVPYFRLLSLSCQPKRYASSYDRATLPPSLSFSPSLPLALRPSFALLRNNEGIYFINTGYSPRGIVLSDGEGK